MLLPSPRGPVSRCVVTALRRPPGVAPTVALGPRPVVDDADVQLALWVLYELHYRGFDDAVGDREWDTGLIALRQEIEVRFERELRRATYPILAGLPGTDALDERGGIGVRLLDLVAGHSPEPPVPSVAAFLHRHAELRHVLDYLRQSSLQQLKESDPQSFVLPRLTGAAKVALAEVQYDEYGAGRPDRLHQHLFAQTLAAAGLDPTYGAYVDETSGAALAVANVMSLFALNRRLRGAALGHFAAFEASSSVPCRKVVAGMERLGLPAAAWDYFAEHVEADAVHEQVAAHDICGAFVATEPHLADDVLFGAASVLHLDAAAARALFDRWESPSPAVGVLVP